MIETLASFALLLALASSARAGTLLTLKNIELSVYVHSPPRSVHPPGPGRDDQQS